MTTQNEMPETIYLIQPHDCDETEVIWTTDRDCYDGAEAYKYIRADLTQPAGDVQEALGSNGLTPSENILIDALKFYAAKEHWMANTENGQPFTLCALKHALDYAGWVHAHGQLQRWAIAKHFESERALSQQITKPQENVSCADLSNDALEQAICDLEMHRDSNFHVMEQKNVVLLIDTLRAEQKGGC